MKITENLLTPGKTNRPGEKIIRLKAVVMHWLAALGQRPVNTREWWESGNAVGSAHYVIGTDGDIMRTIPENEVGYHVGSIRPDPKSGRIYTDKARELLGPEAFTGKTASGAWITPNFFTIGIEMSHINMMPGDFTEFTLQAAAELCADILKRYSLPICAVTTHNEMVGWKECPRLWTYKPELFDEFKDRIASFI
jgi:N-acetylmuramoyl-L-alanine amidase